MSELDALYLSLLRYGLLLVRDALKLGNAEWAKAEAEHLHEIPTLIGSDNVHRHLDYMRSMREVYLKFVESANLPDLNTRVETYYRPVWRQMAALLVRHGEAAKRCGLGEYAPIPLPPAHTQPREPTSTTTPAAGG